MKLLKTLTVVAAMLAAPAYAIDFNTTNNLNTNTNVNTQGQAQGQQQGQGQLQGQNQSSSVNVEGSVSAPGMGCKDWGFSLGIPGAGAAGLCVPGKISNAVAVANAYIAAGAPQRAILVLDQTHLSQKAFKATAAPVATSTRSAPVKASYLSCGRNTEGQLVVKVRGGSTEAQKKAAAAECQAAN